MATIKRVGLPWTTLSAGSASWKYIPASGWFPCGGIDKVRVTFEVQGISDANMDVKPVLQAANNVGGSFTQADLGDEVSADGVEFPDGFQTITSTTQANQIARFVWAVKLSSGSLSGARVSGNVEIVICD